VVGSVTDAPATGSDVSKAPDALTQKLDDALKSPLELAPDGKALFAQGGTLQLRRNNNGTVTAIGGGRERILDAAQRKLVLDQLPAPMNGEFSAEGKALGLWKSALTPAGKGGGSPQQVPGATTVQGSSQALPKEIHFKATYPLVPVLDKKSGDTRLLRINPGGKIATSWDTAWYKERLKTCRELRVDPYFWMAVLLLELPGGYSKHSYGKGREDVGAPLEIMQDPETEAPLSSAQVIEHYGAASGCFVEDPLANRVHDRVGPELEKVAAKHGFKDWTIETHPGG
jgi:hypothetical protein